MKKFPLCGVFIALLFSVALVQTASAQNIGTALVNGAPQINSGRVEGNVQQMTGVNATLNSGAVITGDLLVPGTPTLIKNGQYTFGGVIVGTGSASPSNYQVILNGSVTLGHLRTRTNPVAIPAWPPVPSPTGTRTVTITAAGQSAGSFATLRNFTLNGNVGQYAVPPGTYGDFIANAASGFTLGVAGSTQPAIYNLQHLTLNGATKLLVVGPVILNVANGFTANGTAGTSANPAWLKLNIVTGGFTVNGGCTLYGYATAPNGTLIINGAAKLIGGASCNALTINANGLLQLFDAGSFENKSPTVAITSPAADTVFNTGTAITLVASAADPDGSVSKVEFFAGTTKLGEATSSPWTYAWQNAAAGSYQLTAIATDNLGAKTTSVAVPIRVNTPPTVALTAPANQSVFPPGGVITLTANAADSDGTIQKVEFFSDGTKLGEKTSIPYSFSWNGAATGPHALTARATDNNGAQTSSAAVNIRVNAAPSATMTAPANGSVVQAGSVIPLAANASDSDGTIAKVEFYAGATKVGEDTTAPYQFNWSNAAAGHYALCAGDRQRWRPRHLGADQPYDQRAARGRDHCSGRSSSFQFRRHDFDHRESERSRRHGDESGVLLRRHEDRRSERGAVDDIVAGSRAGTVSAFRGGHGRSRSAGHFSRRFGQDQCAAYRHDHLTGGPGCGATRQSHPAHGQRHR